MFCYFARSVLAVILVAALACWGCRRGPGRVHPPEIDASVSAKQAMVLYDKDGDGVVKGTELEAAPSLKGALKTLDKDGDGAVSVEEIIARINAWKDSRIGLMSLSCTVRRQGQPLAGATVTFEPEKFLGDEVQAAAGTTNIKGRAVLTIPERGLPGVACGLYLIRISKKYGGQEAIPPVYNQHTILGREVAIDALDMETGFLFNLTQ